jgi:hypothetical protein
MREPRHVSAAAAPALALWAGWTAATYLLEGWRLTLLRPEAVGDRILYVGIANLGIGILGAGLVLRSLIRRGLVTPRQVGFGAARRSLVAVLVGGALGLAIYLAQGAPALHPMVLLNGFAQVLVVSIAEVLVCWAVLGGAFAAALARRVGRWGAPLAALAAAVLFGVYHFAHSPPFNTYGMVALLCLVGLVTGTFFFVSRDIYGTLVFHNFLALFGVLGALEQTGRLGAYIAPQGALLGSAALGLVVLVAVHMFWLRTAVHPSEAARGARSVASIAR